MPSKTTWGKVVFRRMNKLVQTCAKLFTITIRPQTSLYKLSVQGQLIRVLVDKLNTTLYTSKFAVLNLLNSFYTHNPHPLLLRPLIKN